jgi:hypothetical protein
MNRDELALLAGEREIFESRPRAAPAVGRRREYSGRCAAMAPEREERTGALRKSLKEEFSFAATSLDIGIAIAKAFTEGLSTAVNCIKPLRFMRRTA